ncbi:upstream activation factor subunit spp27-like [Rhododendron vialii]|uniref:upstream activation factor subunit spp27-like n=1 Tax=Rhododendron vialii TaxID=182163 RepID=UPI00265D8635|nr:upstream activation factor subunit spp27-like [Rhododendron vialii]
MLPLARQDDGGTAPDSDLSDRLRQLLRTCDLRTTTATALRRALEAEFGVDLSDRRAFIRRRIELFLDGRDDEITTENDGADDVDGEAIEWKKAESVVTYGDERTGCEEDGEEGEERSGKRRRKGRSDKVVDVVKKRAGGFMKPSGLSPQLQTFVGVSELARTQVVKRIWAYIREKNLQDPKDKRTIICDQALRAIFRVKSIDMFQMSKALNKHMLPLAEEDGSVKSSQKKKRRKQGREGSNERQVKTVKGKTLGFLAPLTLSDALVKFFGTGENELSRGDVVKKVWEYIKQNDLQDPSDKKTVICDEKLKELFEVDSFTGFHVSKLVTAHFVKGIEQ